MELVVTNPVACAVTRVPVINHTFAEAVPIVDAAIAVHLK